MTPEEKGPEIAPEGKASPVKEAKVDLEKALNMLDECDFPDSDSESSESEIENSEPPPKKAKPETPQKSVETFQPEVLCGVIKTPEKLAETKSSPNKSPAKKTPDSMSPAEAKKVSFEETTNRFFLIFS